MTNRYLCAGGSYFGVYLLVRLNLNFSPGIYFSTLNQYANWPWTRGRVRPVVDIFYIFFSKYLEKRISVPPEYLFLNYKVENANNTPFQHIYANKLVKCTGIEMVSFFLMIPNFSKHQTYYIQNSLPLFQNETNKKICSLIGCVAKQKTRTK